MSVFSPLIDQSQVVEILKDAAQAAHNSNDLSQAMTSTWLFTGPPGSGRSNAAIAFAAALVCKEGGCSKCNDCLSTILGTHADVELIKTQGLSIKIDEVRELITRATWAPSVANYRVVVIENADRLTDSAANALLKVIEEPGLRTIWLLCAPTLTDVLPTIRSRCRHLSLRTPSTKAITNLLIERDEVDAKTAEFIARTSGGHIGRARRLATDKDTRQNRTKILKLLLTLKNVPSAFQAAQFLVDAAKEEALKDSEKMSKNENLKLEEALGSSGSKIVSGSSKQFRELEKLQKSRLSRMNNENLDLALLDIALFYRTILVFEYTEVVEFSKMEEMPNESVLFSLPKHQIIEKIKHVLKTRENLKLNVTPQLALESLFCRLL